MMKNNLTDYKWALVTGASSGIGEEFAYQLSKRGMNLVLVGRDKGRLDEVASRVSQLGVEAVPVAEDLTKGLDEVIRVISERKIDIDLLINSAGIGIYGDFIEKDISKPHEMIEINVKVLTDLAYIFSKKMVERGKGGIINVSSIAGLFPVPYYAVYGATKAYVYSFSLALWAELRDKNVHVLCLAPGKTKTRHSERAGSNVGGKKMEPAEVVRITLKSFERGDPFVLPGPMNKIFSFIGGIFPDKLVVRVIGSFPQYF
ncbi:MAG: hypothetical protein AUJ99_02155 [Caldisericum sp. CG2_30_36_11]|nr:MAG: hypothetical protein AUJ99_02155 [Caldisericum sp. CG2_30_36_11]